MMGVSVPLFHHLSDILPSTALFLSLHPLQPTFDISCTWLQAVAATTHWNSLKHLPRFPNIEKYEKKRLRLSAEVKWLSFFCSGLMTNAAGLLGDCVLGERNGCAAAGVHIPTDSVTFRPSLKGTGKLAPVLRQDIRVQNELCQRISEGRRRPAGGK